MTAESARRRSPYSGVSAVQSTFKKSLAKLSNSDCLISRSVKVFRARVPMTRIVRTTMACRLWNRRIVGRRMMHARQLALSMMAAGVVVTHLPILAGCHSTSHAPAASLIGARKAQTYSKDLPAEPSAAKLYAIRATRLPVSTVTVRANDTLSTIAQRVWGDSSLWPDLWWANRQKVPNPDVLSARVLTLPAAHPAPGWRLERALAAIPAPPAPAATSTAGSGGGNASPPAPPPPAPGIYSFSALESLWVRAGGPSWAEAAAASIAECESGGGPTNYYGKSARAPYTGTQAPGLWQILGQVVAGDTFESYVNALNAVSKFRS